MGLCLEDVQNLTALILKFHASLCFCSDSADVLLHYNIYIVIFEFRFYFCNVTPKKKSGL